MILPANTQTFARILVVVLALTLFGRRLGIGSRVATTLTLF